MMFVRGLLQYILTMLSRLPNDSHVEMVNCSIRTSWINTTSWHIKKLRNTRLFMQVSNYR